MLRRATITAMALTVLAPASLGALARANGDPASDVLLGQSVFYPYAPPVSASLQQSLNAQTAAAARAGFPLKVALIGSPVDLGVVPDLFGKPQKYADFLDQEISFKTKQPLLVVMPSGYGVQGVPAAAKSMAASLGAPIGKQSSDLARAALSAVPRLAAAAGHPIKGGSGSSGGGTLLIVLVAAALLVAVGLAVLTLRRRQLAG